MNLIGAVLVHLWVAGWVIAALRAVLKALASATDGPISSK